jgi:hypothetical protein
MARPIRRVGRHDTARELWKSTKICSEIESRSGCYEIRNKRQRAYYLGQMIDILGLKPTFTGRHGGYLIATGRINFFENSGFRKIAVRLPAASC